MALRGAEVDVAVVGGGVVGLACAAALARAGRSVLLFERHEGLGRETTSRNSEVVHSGLYYPEDSLKARLCVAGRERLYERCQRLRVPCRKLGKWIVATRPEEIPTLEALERQGRANGVTGLHWVEPAEIARQEPDLRALAALASPESGIVDAQALCASFAAEAEERGAQLVLRSQVLGVEHRGSLYRLEVCDASGELATLSSAALVNAAGLAGDALAERAGLDVEARGYRLHLCTGGNIDLRPGAPQRLSRLIYPVPAGAGLGIHVTLDLGGRVRFGPDAEYVAAPDYRVEPAKAATFAAAAGRYLPALRADWLTPDYAGLRPKLAAPGQGFRDFVVAEESEAGLPGLVSCLGIESPGLTAAPAIAERVVSLLAGL